MRCVIQKIGRDVKSIVLEFPSDRAVSLRIINEKHCYVASGIQSKAFGLSFSKAEKNDLFKLWRAGLT